MPDLLDDLRRYGDAVEAAALDRTHDEYPVATPPPDVHRRRRPRHRAVLLGVAAAILCALIVGIALLRTSDHDSVRIDTPPTTVAPTRPARVPATVLPASDATWTQLAPSPLSTRGGASAVWTGSALLVWGGVDSVTERTGPNYSDLADGAAYDSVGDRWTMIPPAPIDGRGYHVAAWTGSEMLVFGGGGPSYEAAAHADGAAYDPASSTWRTLAQSPLPLGPHYEGVWTGDKLFVMGIEGRSVRAATYDPVADAWTTLPPPTLPASASDDLRRLLVVHLGTQVVAVLQQRPAAALVFDDQNRSWTTSVAPDAWWNIAAAVPYGERIETYVQSTRYPDDGPVSFDPTNGSWAEATSITDFGCESGPVLETTGTSVFMTACGGSGFYNPDRSTWQPVASPTGGSPEQAIWTGDRLLWLGFDSAEWEPGARPPMRLWSLTP